MKIYLRFNRNHDVRTEFYYVYRSYTPAITKASRRIMKIKHPSKADPLIIKDEFPAQIGEKEFQLQHTHLLSDGIQEVYIDQILIPSSYLIDHEKGILYLNHEIGDSHVAVTYAFDGMEISDSREEQKWVDEYYGPLPNPEYDIYYVIEARNASGGFSNLSKPFIIKEGGLS